MYTLNTTGITYTFLVHFDNEDALTPTKAINIVAEHMKEQPGHNRWDNLKAERTTHGVQYWQITVDVY